MLSDSILLITLGALLVLSPLVRSLSERVGLPSTVGYIFLGISVSAIDNQWSFIDSTFEYVFSVLAELGVVALLFRVGLRCRIKALLAKLPDASQIWCGDVAELDDLSGVLLLTVLLAIIPVLLFGEPGLLGSAGMTALITLLKFLAFVGFCYAFSRYLEEGFTRFNRRVGGDGMAFVITILGTGLAISAAAAAAKLVGVAVPALLILNRTDALALGVSMIPRAEIALLVVYQCSLLGEDVVSQEIFAGVVITSILTCITAPPVARKLLRSHANSK
jgi:Kef-type K+ transport system membrane component KefB